jgi:hypothetical protein
MVGIRNRLMSIVGSVMLGEFRVTGIKVDMMDKKYYVKVADLMNLPRPRKRYTDSTGDTLPLISIEVELWSPVTW